MQCQKIANNIKRQQNAARPTKYTTRVAAAAEAPTTNLNSN